jgi:hypothetical protein
MKNTTICNTYWSVIVASVLAICCLSSPADGKAAHPAQLPLLDLAPKQEDGVPMPTLCAECAKYYENEATVVRAKAAGTNLALTFFPGWPQADEPKTSHKVQ